LYNNEVIITLLQIAGQILPMVMFSYQKLSAVIIKKVPSDQSIGRSEWMDNWRVILWIHNQCILPVRFTKWNSVSYNHVFGWTLFTCYMTLSDFCIAHKIELILLYPQCTLHNPWLYFDLWRKKAVCNWRIENDNMTVKKSDFAPLLEIVIESINTEKSLSNGFTCYTIFGRGNQLRKTVEY